MFLQDFVCRISPPLRKHVEPGLIRRLGAPALAASIPLLVACSADPEGAGEAGSPPGSPLERANVVFLIIDTLRADKLGIYGSAVDSSPELDALAERGVLFERAIAQSSWTRPSIGSMVTGIYPRTLGIYKEEKDRLPGRFETLSEVLGGHGYETIGVTANPNINAVFGFDQGFDAYFDSKRPPPWMLAREKRRTSGGKAAAGRGYWTAREVFRIALDAVGPDPDPPYFLQLNIMEMHEPEWFVREEYRSLFPEVAEPKSRAYLQALGRSPRMCASSSRS